MRTKRTKTPKATPVKTPSRIRLSASKAREEFSETIDRVRYTGQRVMLHKHGKDVAAIVSTRDLQLLERLEEDADYRAAVDRLNDPQASRVSYDTIQRKLGLT